LAQFAGTILLVSHDRYFVDALATYTWALEPLQKTIVVYRGGYSNYLSQKDTQNSVSTNGKEEPQKGKQIREQTKAEKRIVEQKARQVAEIEAIIETTESELTQLTQKLEDASFAQDVPLLQELGQAYQLTEKKLEQLIAQWAEMEAV